MRAVSGNLSFTHTLSLSLSLSRARALCRSISLSFALDSSRTNESDCYVGAWSSEDLHSWIFRPILTLPRPLTVPNVAVSMVPPRARGRSLPSALPMHQAWMALDAPAPPIAVNVLIPYGGNLIL